MNKSVLVTLADKNYIDQAKQLFSSVYWNAGWKGDYLLLAHEVPEEELKWFREKGILVKKCAPIRIGNLQGTYPISALDKFYLFTPEFKKWDNVVFVDSDIIVRYPLDALAHVKGFCASPDSAFFSTLEHQFYLRDPKDPTVVRFKKSFKSNAPALNSGVMAFSTDIIGAGTFQEMLDIGSAYQKIASYAEQSILSLYFYGKWKRLSFLYNILIPVANRTYHIRPENIVGFVVHFCGKYKPWHPDDPFYPEWRTNRDKAEDIVSFNQPVERVEVLGRYGIMRYELYFECYRIPFGIYHSIDRTIGRIGLFLKKRSPWLYTKLKGTPS